MGPADMDEPGPGHGRAQGGEDPPERGPASTDNVAGPTGDVIGSAPGGAAGSPVPPVPPVPPGPGPAVPVPAQVFAFEVATAFVHTLKSWVRMPLFTTLNVTLPSGSIDSFDSLIVSSSGSPSATRDY